MANRERITLKPEVPTTITLAQAVPGKEVNGPRNEIDYMYAVCTESGGEGVIFVPPHAAAQLDQTRAKAGETLEITRRAKGAWAVVHIVDPPQRPQQLARPTQPKRTPEEQAAEEYRIDHRKGHPFYDPEHPDFNPLRHDPQQQTTRPAPPATPHRTEEDLLTAQLAASVRREQPATSTTASMYSRYLCAAIDAWSLAIQYAREKGIPLTPSAKDVRAVAATLYIEATKK